MVVHGGPAIRTIDPDETDRFIAAFSLVFASEPTDHQRQRAQRLLHPDRTFVATAGDDVVATGGVYPFDLALPGGGTVPCAGVTMISVRPDHRRRGLLRRLLRAIHDQARDRGEPFAALWASETPIYGRFGYGPAMPTLEFEAQRAHVRLTVPAPVQDVTLVDTATARRELPPIREAVRRERPGLLSRSDAWWDSILDDDPVDERDGAGQRCHALVPGRGYAIYRIVSRWEAGAPTGTVRVRELHATDPEAAAALWAFVTDLDLTSRIVAAARPPDEPFLAMVEDTARLSISHGWPLYLRLLDLPAALTARPYAVDGRLVLEVVDSHLPSNEGRWALEVEGGIASCERTEHAADLTLDTRELATVLLGGNRVSQLVAAGRVAARDPDVVRRFDALVATRVAPWHEGMF
jgi:predicted acetyltransferase